MTQRSHALNRRGTSSGQGPMRWLAAWWMVLDFAAQMLVLVLTPSSYRRSQHRALQLQLVAATAPLLPAFIAICAMVSLVIIQIVLATAASYGLDRFALDVLVRALVIELMPLLVALFVALRYTMPSGEQVAMLRAEGKLRAMWRGGGDPARDELLPRVVAGVFSVALLSLVSCALALLLTYVSVYGFTTWGFDAYTRAVGQVFNPAVSLIFMLKALFFSLAVAVLPIAPDRREAALRRHDHIGILGRVFAAILLVEVCALAGNYY